VIRRRFPHSIFWTTRFHNREHVLNVKLHYKSALLRRISFHETNSRGLTLQTRAVISRFNNRWQNYSGQMFKRPTLYLYIYITSVIIIEVGYLRFAYCTHVFHILISILIIRHARCIFLRNNCKEFALHNNGTVYRVFFEREKFDIVDVK